MVCDTKGTFHVNDSWEWICTRCCDKIKAAKIDMYGRHWDLPFERLCPVCFQPDDYNDCNHKELSSKQVAEMHGH
jgi:hypothetical protein